MPAFNKAFGFATSLAAGALLAGTSAPAAVLYEQTFDPFDAALPAGTAIFVSSVVDAGGGNGVLSLNDTETGKKSFLSVLQTFDQPVMTFSFDVVAPVVQSDGAQNELILRADGGSSTSISGSSGTVVELILYRNGNRTGYQNTGNETAFIVANNDNANSLDFSSPVDNATITLAANQYAAFVRDNSTGLFSQAKGPSNFGSGAPVLTHFAIGNASNAYLGSASIDNVRVVDSVSFGAVPEPASLSLLTLPAASLLRRRRRTLASHG